MRSKSKTAGYDMGVVARLDRVIAPKQARSAESLERILAALEHLLRRQSFDDITMADIEKESGCGLASIYARFRNKNSILVALHETTSERFRQGVDKAMAPQRLEGRPPAEVAAALARGLVKHYSTHRHLLRAGMLLGDQEIYERAASLILYAASRIQAAIARPDKASDPAYRRRLDLGTSAVYALVQQRLIFHPIQTRRFSHKDDAFAEDLAQLLLICAELE